MARFKILFYYLSEFLLSIFVFLLLLLGIVKLTLLRPDFVLKEFSKNDYYDKVSDSILDEMSNYIIQSGLDDSVLENVYTKQMVEEDIRSFIVDFYNGKELSVSTETIQKNIEDNILAYLEKNNITVDDQEGLDSFVEQMLTVYEDKITFSGGLHSFQNTIVKANSLVTAGFIVLLLVSIVLYALIKFVCRRKVVFAAPCFTTAILVLLANYFFFQRVDVAHILFWNAHVSSVLKSIIYSVSRMTIIGAIVFLIFGILNTLVWALKRRKRRPSSYSAVE